MSTRGLHLRLAAVLAGASLAVAACGGGSATSSGQSDDKPGSKAPQGVTDTAIKIGATMPITGPIAGAGGALSNGLKIAVESVNAAGGTISAPDVTVTRCWLWNSDCCSDTGTVLVKL